LFGAFEAIGAHGARLGKAFGEQGGGFAHALLHAGAGAADAFAEALQRHDGDRVEQRRDKAHLPVEIDHGADQAEHGDAVAEGVDGADEGFANGCRVGREAGGQGRGRFAFDAGEIGLHQVGEHAFLQLADDDEDEALEEHGLPYWAADLALVTATTMAGIW